MPKLRPTLARPLVATPPSDALPALAAPLLAEIGAFCEAFLPAAERDDFELASLLYIETHPSMRERWHELLAHTLDESGALPLDQPATNTDHSDHQGERGKGE